ncbi:hypothetical protein GCM10023194_15530 [Planotetraspora phitsanulokensis]|uniref:Uncharacterized protein n=1 Tax=Planotetraspora phitsanulokensis TaxID=575192 RepID=A0A8J3UH94_9ACTN|nr:hypothetical protein Pph01_38380 [Planotetraspora phitsanulokensis]
MLAASSPRSAAMRQTASAIWRRLGEGAAGASLGAVGGFLRRRYALAWQPREQYARGRPRAGAGRAAPQIRHAPIFSSRTYAV